MNVKSMVLTGLLFAASAVHANSLVGVGTMAQGTLSYTTGSVIAKVMKEKMGLEARVQPNSGETVLVPLINAGELEFGIANILEAHEAMTGQGAFNGRPQAGLRIASALFPLQTAYFVRADSPIKSLADLKGKRVTVGFSAMGSVDKIAKALLASGGINQGDYRPVLVPNVVAAADQLLNDRADAFFFALGAAKVAEVNASVPLRALPMPTDAASQARAKAVFGDGYPAPVLATQGIVGVTENMSVMGFDNMLLTSEKTKPELIKQVLSGMAAHKADLVAAFPGFRGLDPKQMVKPSLQVPYHPASLEWARSQR
jgi:TRAP transporter TAXI family solute receptor